MNIKDVEFHSWSGNKSKRSGVLAVHVPTGVAVIVSSERSPGLCQLLAEERLTVLVDATEVGMWSG